MNPDDHTQPHRGATAGPASGNPATLEALGWNPFFAGQISAEAGSDRPPVRVVAVHRSGLQVVGLGSDETIPPRADVTVGDWLLLDRAHPGASPLLSRKSLVKRRAPGTNRQVQLIAANIDTAFVVTSCNQDFNLARLERYVALAFEAQIAPVIVLTKADLVPNRQSWIDAARTVSERIPVVALDARGDAPAVALSAWCKPGRTVAFLGSSGCRAPGKGARVREDGPNGDEGVQDAPTPLTPGEPAQARDRLRGCRGGLLRLPVLLDAGP
jgi:ribosome biogenesis GTPase